VGDAAAGSASGGVAAVVVAASKKSVAFARPRPLRADAAGEPAGPSAGDAAGDGAGDALVVRLDVRVDMAVDECAARAEQKSCGSMREHGEYTCDEVRTSAKSGQAEEETTSKTVEDCVTREDERRVCARPRNLAGAETHTRAPCVTMRAFMALKLDVS
jgi:hypothetical protein